MFKNYLKLALRNMRNQKIYSFINIGGLAVGLAASILLLLWVNDEMSFNRFNVKSGRLYKLASQFKEDNIWGVTPAPAAVYAKNELPEVEDACRISGASKVIWLQYRDTRITQKNNALADAALFNMFTFPLLEGNAAHPFNDANSIVISSTMAGKLFGKADAMGKVVTADDKNFYTVTGVMKEMPTNSTIRYDVVFNFKQLELAYNSTGQFKTLSSNWSQYSFDTYVLLRPGANPVTAGQKLGRIHVNHFDNPFSHSIVYLFNPISKIHLYSDNGKEQGMAQVRVFFIVAMIILLIACINYVNLFTARASKRNKEISLRKIVGAARMELFIQFIIESLTMFLIALVLATCLIYWVMPVYNSISGKDILFKPWSAEVLAVYGMTLLATLVMAGIYPAIMLSWLKPLDAMKGKLSGMANKNGVRKVLVTVQFSFTIVLIISTIVIGDQLAYIRKKNIGYNKDHVIRVNMRNMSSHYEAAKASLLSQPSVTGVTQSDVDIVNTGSGTSNVQWDGKDASNQSFAIGQMSVAQNFLQVMGIKLVAGSGFTGPADSSNFVLNETAVKSAGLKAPIIGKRFAVDGVEGFIVGVVRDFHFQNMHTQIAPLVMQYSKKSSSKIYIKTSGSNIQQTLAAVEQVWKQYNQGYDFTYTFLDSEFEDLYKSDLHVGQLFGYFSVITILISCLGLFGLVTFTAETRVKEIGIRKTLGASVLRIVMLLSKDFLLLVVFAAAISFPVTWWGLNNFLQGYAYRTTLSWWTFVAAGIATMFIAFITVSYRCVQAALANPIKALKNE
jgi:putative ABC transport system permease protein